MPSSSHGRANTILLDQKLTGRFWIMLVRTLSHTPSPIRNSAMALMSLLNAHGPIWFNQFSSIKSLVPVTINLTSSLAVETMLKRPSALTTSRTVLLMATFGRFANRIQWILSLQECQATSTAWTTWASASTKILPVGASITSSSIWWTKTLQIRLEQRSRMCLLTMVRKAHSLLSIAWRTFTIANCQCAAIMSSSSTEHLNTPTKNA